MKLAMAGLVLTLCAQVAFSRTPPQTRKPAKTSDAVERDPVFPLTGKLVFEGKVVRGSIRKSEVDSLLARRVEVSGATESQYGKYGLGFIYEEGMLPAFSCQEWAQATMLGLDSSFNTYERSMNSFFIDTCSFLYALRAAKPAKRSFISNPQVGLSNLNLLPANVLESFSGDSEEEVDKSARKARISQLVAKREAKVLHRAKTSLELDYDYYSKEKTYTSRMIFNERGRADFDGDGIEDIFVSTAFYATQGTMRAYDYFLLTRRSLSAVFQIKKIELPAIKENPGATITGLEFRASKLKRVRLSKQAYGETWPFNQERGELACVKSGSVAVFWIAGGNTYPLNVWARGSKIDGVAVSSDTRDVDNGQSLTTIFAKAFAMCQPK